MSHATFKLKQIDQSLTPLHAAAKRTWTTLCTTTNMHGLKYMHDKSTNRIVRAIWIFIVVLSLFLAIIMVHIFYMQYHNNITRMTIENYIPVSTLTFPAVTICPDTMFNIAQSKRYLATLKHPPGGASISEIIAASFITYRFINDQRPYYEKSTTNVKQLKKRKKVKDKEEDYLSDIEFLQGDPTNKDINVLENLMAHNNISIMTLMQNFQWNCEDIIFRCRFQNFDCRALFQRSKTSLGFCCSFNLNQWGLNYTGYPALSTFTQGLRLILYNNDTDYGEITSHTQGFKLLISHNDGYPSFYSDIKFLNAQHESFVNMRPFKIHCSDSVKKLEFNERQCALPHEFPLKHFKSNADVNCQIECRIDRSIDICGCIPYFFQTDWTQERICSFKDLPCLLKNFAEIIGRYRKAQCDCPPNCSTSDYELDLTHTTLEVDVPVVDDFYEGIKKTYAVVNIFIESLVFPRYKLDLIYNKLILISNLGSAFSLFLGISMVSLVEIVYYIAIVLRKFYKQEVEARQKLRRQTLRVVAQWENLKY